MPFTRIDGAEPETPSGQAGMTCGDVPDKGVQAPDADDGAQRASLSRAGSIRTVSPADGSAIGASTEAAGEDGTGDDAGDHNDVGVRSKSTATPASALGNGSGSGQSSTPMDVEEEVEAQSRRADEPSTAEMARSPPPDITDTHERKNCDSAAGPPPSVVANREHKSKFGNDKTDAVSEIPRSEVSSSGRNVPEEAELITNEGKGAADDFNAQGGDSEHCAKERVVIRRSPAIQPILLHTQSNTRPSDNIEDGSFLNTTDVIREETGERERQEGAHSWSVLGLRGIPGPDLGPFFRGTALDGGAARKTETATPVSSSSDDSRFGLLTGSGNRVMAVATGLRRLAMNGARTKAEGSAALNMATRISDGSAKHEVCVGCG